MKKNKKNINNNNNNQKSKSFQNTYKYITNMMFNKSLHLTDKFTHKWQWRSLQTDGNKQEAKGGKRRVPLEPGIHRSPSCHKTTPEEACQRPN